MDRETFVSQVKDWLIESGAVRQLQTKLRSDLIEAITKSEDNRLKIRTKGNIRCSPEDGTLNTLLIEHLMTRGLWYSSSVMANEADFAPWQPPNIEETVVVGSGQSSQQHPVKMTDEQISGILNGMEALDVDHISSQYFRQRRASILDLIFAQLKLPLAATKPGPLVTHATSVQTQPVKELATKATQTKDNLMVELEDAREEIERLREENQQLEMKLNQAVQAKFNPNPPVQLDDPEYLRGANHFVAKMRSRLSALSDNNQKIMTSMKKL